MSPICQSFVQNAWRKDLCSNCFKSEEEHGGFKSSLNSSLKSDYINDSGGVGPRYVGVAGRQGLYSRNYYGSKSWNPVMIDNSNNDSRLLKSPGLIKGMNSIIKQENEKNRTLNVLNNFGDNNEPSKNIDDVISRSIPKDSWILSQIIGDPKGIKNTERSERMQGDSSSDLGSDASHDTSGNTSGCSENELKGDSDASSIKIDQDSAHEDDSPIHGILKSNQPGGLQRTLKVSISFKDDAEVIGYGGDVHYSDDDYYEDEDDDDNSSISSELTPEDKYLKQLTEKNTNFNSENENLAKEQDTNEKEKDLDPYDLNSLKNDITCLNTSGSEKVDDMTNRQEIKVKLKRSHPILGSKPQIKPNLSSSYSNVPNLLNAQTGTSCKEVIPMQGIKPKFVSREDEMQENTKYEDMYERHDKITAINSSPTRVTSVDDLTARITSIDDLPPKITLADDLPHKVTSVDCFNFKPAPIDEHSSNTSPTRYVDTKIKEDNFVENIHSDVICGKEPIRDTINEEKAVLLSPNDNVIECLAVKPSSIDDLISVINNTPPKCSSKDAKSRKSNLSKVSRSLNSGMNDECHLKVTYIDNVSTYECQPSSESSKNPLHKSIQENKAEVISYLSVTKVRENTDSCDKNIINELDYTVKSGPDTFTKKFDETDFRSNGKDESSDKQSLRELERSKENIDKVSSAVIPMNMITIQRRSSFMESQLGGSVFSIDMPLGLPKKATPIIKNQSNILSKPRELTENLVNAVSTSTDEGILKENNKNYFKISAYSQKNDFPKESKESNIFKNRLKFERETNQNKELTKIFHDEIASEAKNDELNNKEKNKANKTLETADNSTNCSESNALCENQNKADLSNFTPSEKLKTNGSSNSPLSTFGTQVTSAKTPNASFLHSGAIKPVADLYEINSVIYSTPEFLKDIKSYSDQAPVTASIQKSALYASSSALKGVPLAKPATTPKPSFLKDKPKVPIKPFMSTSCILTREGLQKQSNVGASSILDVDLNNATEIEDATVLKNKFDNNSFDNRKPPPSGEAPKIPDITNTEIVYDVPVTVASSSSTTFSSPSPSSSSSGYSSTSVLSQNCNNVYKEIKEDIQFKENNEDITEAKETTVKDKPTKTDTTDDSVESHYRANFEGTRKALSESLSFENKNEVITELECAIKEEKTTTNSQDNTNAIAETAEIEVVKDTNLALKDTNNSESQITSNFQPPTTPLPPSYVNLHPIYDSHDVDSYSSFTDDFEDDDDDDDDYKTNQTVFLNIDNRENVQPLRRTERSSSATALFRNSVGPVNIWPLNNPDPPPNQSGHEEPQQKPPAVRSQSVPRSSDIFINPSVFGKNKQESSSKFGFVKSGFFRPSSPPSIKRKLMSERGRDRSKKSSSGFSLRKLLRFGSGDKTFKEFKSPKTQEKNYQRETRKLKLEIIHPLDYNTNGVEVIARPEKKSPSFDLTGFNDPLVQEALRQHALQNQDKNLKTSEPPKSSSSAPFFGFQNKKEENSKKKTGLGKVTKKNSFLKKKRKPDRNDSQRSEASIGLGFNRQRDSSAGSGLEATANGSLSYSNKQQTSSQSAANLGFNSEGRPRPPPPPRKTSLDANSQEPNKVNQCLSRNHPDHTYVSGSSNGSKMECDTSSLSSSCSSIRPTRPPPPRRTPSNCLTAQGLQGLCQRTKDSVYANLGNARASFTPRKPGRTSSIRDDEREKRRAPNPPLPPAQQQQYQNQHYQQQQQQQQQLQNPQQHQPYQTQQHPQQHFQQQQRQQQIQSRLKNELNQTLQSPSENTRHVKGPAPPTPVNNNSVFTHDYEYISSSPEKENEKQPDFGRSPSSSGQEKTSRQRGRRGSVVTNLSLEDQYGAVVYANLEALSNMLDQMCSQNDCGNYEIVKEQVSSWSQISVSTKEPIACGLRLLYSGIAANCEVTIMVTPETKVELDPMMMPNALVTFKEEIPARFLPTRKSEYAFLLSSVFIFPRMDLSSLEEFSHHSLQLLQERPSEWERRICLFLLQVVSALKQLQAKGIEEASLDMILVITRAYGDDNSRLWMVSSESSGGSTLTRGSESALSLCHCAAAATQLLLGHSEPLETALKGPILCPPFTPSPHAFTTLVTTLREERSSSLTKAKCILEAMLFGPEDIKVETQPDGELALQKWLDLERANVLHSMVREQASGSFSKNCVLSKFHLIFLVRTNVKALKDAMKALEAPDVTNF